MVARADHSITIAKTFEEVFGRIADAPHERRRSPACAGQLSPDTAARCR
jgi:hypothetical protein